MDFVRIRSAFSLKANLRSLWDRPGERYAAIDGLRALSMLWVVVTHLCLVISRFVPYDTYVRMMDKNRWLFAWVLHGEKSLDSFFVISGFLIGLILLSEHKKRGSIDLRKFFVRRYLRLMPAYAVALLVLLASGVEPEKARYVWANILYVNNFLPQRHMFMDPSWSLAVEEQFYVVLPLFLLAVFFRARHRFATLALLLALSMSICALVLALHPTLMHTPYGENFIFCAPHFSSEYFDALYVNLHTRFGPFVLGLGLAWGVLWHGEKLRGAFEQRPWLADALILSGLTALAAVVAVPAFNPHVALSPYLLTAFILCHRYVWSFGVLFIMLAVLFHKGRLSGAVSTFLAGRIWYPIAQLSYCGYLFHLGCVLPGLFLATRFRQPAAPLEVALLHLGATEICMAYAFTLFFTFLVGAVLYLCVERPFLNLRPR